MKVAILVHGSLRTFFLQIKDSNKRICDLFVKSIADPNDADIFVCTDFNDYYLEGFHHFCRSFNTKPESNTRFHQNIKFLEDESAEKMVKDSLLEIIGHRIKKMKINSYYDPRLHPNYDFISTFLNSGANPESLIQQYKKIKDVCSLMESYEKEQGLKYDIIVRTRFDNCYSVDHLSVKDLDFLNYDVFVPGIIDAPLIYDWGCAGKRDNLIQSLNMFDFLGFTMDERIYRIECKDCGKISCKMLSDCVCGSSNLLLNELTLSSEHHLFKIFKINNLRYSSINYPMSPYRFY